MAFVDDQPAVAAHPKGPEVPVFCIGQLVEAHSRLGRIGLHIERRRLDRLLLVAGLCPWLSVV